MQPDRDITQVYVLLAENKEGKEGIVGTMPPFLCSDKKIADKMIKILKPFLLQKAKKENVKLLSQVNSILDLPKQLGKNLGK